MAKLILAALVFAAFSARETRCVSRLVDAQSKGLAVEKLDGADLADFVNDHEYVAVLFSDGKSAKSEKAFKVLQTIDFAGKINIPGLHSCYTSNLSSVKMHSAFSISSTFTWFSRIIDIRDIAAHSINIIPRVCAPLISMTLALTSHNVNFEQITNLNLRFSMYVCFPF